MTEKNVKANVEATARRAKRSAKRATSATKRELDLGKFSPALVGLARGLVLAILVGLSGGIATVIQSGDMGKGGLVWMLTTVATAVFRSIEGYLDKLAGASPSPTLLGFSRK